MKVKDLIPLVKSDIELVTKENGEIVSVCDNDKYTEPMLEAEIKDVFMTGYAIAVEVEYDSSLFLTKKELAKLPNSVWLFDGSEYDFEPRVYYFEAEAKRDFVKIIREYFENSLDEEEISKYSDEEIWKENLEVGFYEFYCYEIPIHK